MERLKITPGKQGKADAGRFVALPGFPEPERGAKYFPTKAEAMGYITNLEKAADFFRTPFYLSWNRLAKERREES